MTEEVMAMLKAKQAFNRSVLKGNGRPSANDTLAYSRAAKNAGHWRLAAEMLEAVERLDPDADYASNICYYYSKDGDQKNSQKWAAIAYDRKPDSVTAYNLALYKRDGDTTKYEQLMDECLEHDPYYSAALTQYGRYLMEKGESLGVEYLQQAFNIFKDKMEIGHMDDNDDINRFKSVAKLLGKSEVFFSIDQLLENKKNEKKTQGYSSANLVGSSGSTSKLLGTSEEG